MGRVLRFFENPAVELEPTQLAVNEIFRVAKTLMRGLRDLHDLRSNDQDGFLFGPCSCLSFRHLSTSTINCAYATRATSDGGRGSLIPDVFCGCCVNGVLCNAGSVLTH